MFKNYTGKEIKFKAKAWQSIPNLYLQLLLVRTIDCCYYHS
jgi:hypothetical protein